jgi:hypothetical protein
MNYDLNIAIWDLFEIWCFRFGILLSYKAFCLDHLGEDGPKDITEGTIIYIKRDHPLYRRESKKKEAHILKFV